MLGYAGLNVTDVIIEAIGCIITTLVFSQETGWHKFRLAKHRIFAGCPLPEFHANALDDVETIDSQQVRFYRDLKRPTVTKK